MQLFLSIVTDARSVITTLPNWAGVVVIVALTLLFTRVIQLGGDVIIRAVTTHIEGDIDDIILEGVHPPLYLSALIVGGYLATIPYTIGLPAELGIRQLMYTALAIVWAIALVRIGHQLSAEAKSDERLDQQLFPIFQNVWSALILGGAIMLVLTVWRVDVTPLLASAGIIGIIVGFAARDTIANFFGSIALYVDGTYRVGDYVVLDGGERGVVEDVSIRSTVIRTRDDVRVTVPNAVLNASTVINESEPESRYRVSIPVGVSYDADPDHVEDTFLAVAKTTEGVLESPTPRVRFRSFGDWALQFELLCWVARPEERGRVIHELNRGIHSAVSDADISIPYPQRVISMEEAPPSEHYLDTA